MKEVPKYMLNGVCVADSGVAYISSSIEQLNDDEIDNMVVHQYGPEGRREFFSAVRAIAGMTPLADGVLCVSIDGYGFEFPPSDVEEEFVETQGEIVDPSEDGPSELVHLKAVRRIGDSIYCAGFARRVYCRGPGRTWRAVDEGVFVPRKRKRKTKTIPKPTGFFAIGGANEQLFYAAGLDGEIWSCRDGRWAKESSPTNVLLTTMASLPNGDVCIAGLVGTLIQGSAGRWRVIEQTATTQPFWGATHFQGRVYVANREGVFVLNDDGSDIEMVHDAAGPFLDSCDTAMWSVGDKGIAWTDDGRRWKSVPAPGA